MTQSPPGAQDSAGTGSSVAPPTAPPGQHPGQPPHGAPGSPYGPPPYGPPPYGPPPYGWRLVRPTNQNAILALVLAFVFPPLGIYFGSRARKEIAVTGDEGATLATAGYVVGWSISALWLAMIAFFCLFSLVPFLLVIFGIGAIDNLPTPSPSFPTPPVPSEPFPTGPLPTPTVLPS